MKLITTFWSKDSFEFDELLYIHRYKLTYEMQEIVFRTKLNDKVATYQFFKDVAKLVNSNKVHQSMYDFNDCYQFAVIHNGNVTPIIWFDLVINDKLTINHDLAFGTTLIKRNDQVIPFGKFPMQYHSKKLPLYREFNLKKRAYTYIANQIKSNQIK